MKTINLFSTDNYRFGANYDELQDEFNELITNNILPKCYPLEQWLTEREDSDWTDFLEELRDFGECVILGTLGLWQRRCEIVPERYGTIVGAIIKCSQNYDYIKVELVDGHLELSVSHHDGTNNFCIFLLNKKGQNAGETADLSKSCYHAKIKL